MHDACQSSKNAVGLVLLRRVFLWPLSGERSESPCRDWLSLHKCVFAVFPQSDIVQQYKSREVPVVRFPCRQFVGASVIFLMALSSVSPIGYTHAHGNQPQNAEGRLPAHVHHHHGGGHHHHHHDHGHSHSHAGDVASESGFHRHLTWWGWEIVFPTQTPNGPENSHDSTDGLDDFIVVAPQSNATSISQLFVKVLAISDLQTELSCGISTKGYRDRCVASQRVLLCDTARHARSGVQLS
jgi:hypothetical protein